MTVPEYLYIWYKGDDAHRHEDSNRIKDRDLQNLSFVMLDALRDTEELLGSWSRSPLKSMLEELGLGEDLAKVAQKIDEDTVELLKRPDLSTLGQRIGQRSRDMVGDIFSVDPTINLISQDADELLRSIKLFVDGDKRRTVNSASLGTLNILYLSLLMERISRDGQTRTANEILNPRGHR